MYDSFHNPPLFPQAAQEHMQWVEQIEHQLSLFVSNQSSQRLALAPMTRTQRALVHELAQEGYGLATVALG